MNRLTALALSALALAASAQGPDPGTLHPVTTTVRHAGRLDWATGTWHRASGNFANAVGSQTIYDNTCPFTGGQMFVGSETCWDRYDDGRIPSTLDPFLPGGLVCDCYTVCGFEIGYCTSEAPGNVHVQIGFYEGLTVSGVGGSCTGFQTTGMPPSGGGTPKPPGNLAGPRDFFIDLSNVGLPADPGGGGTQNCWTVTLDLSNLPNGGYAFCGNGDVVFDNVPDLDNFQWFWGQRGTTRAFGPTGPLQGGDPIFAAPGACTFTTNCGNVNGQPCGTGLGNVDNFWVNVDGTAIGGGGTPAACSFQPAGGTNCYFFGGWPFLPWSSLYMEMYSNAAACAAAPAPPAPIVYCTAKASSSGCLAQISSTTPLVQPVSGADDYDLVTTQIEGLKAGIYFFGISGMSAIPFQGGFLCVDPTSGLGRTKIQFSQGSLQNCDGAFTLRINSGTIFNLDMGPGTSNWVQTWYRDPALMDGFDTALSNAIQVDFQ